MDKNALMIEFRFEVLLLKQNANEINLPVTSPTTDINIEYDYSSCEVYDCHKRMPRTLVINPEFPIPCIPLLKRNQMRIMLQNHYVKQSVDVPDFDKLNDCVLRSRIHLAIKGHLPKPNS